MDQLVLVLDRYTADSRAVLPQNNIAQNMQNGINHSTQVSDVFENQAMSTQMTVNEQNQADLNALMSDADTEEVSLEEEETIGQQNEDSFVTNSSTLNASAESTTNGLNANRTIRNRDIRFSKVKENATQDNPAIKVFRNQLSSYSVTSAKEKYNLNLNLNLKPFPKERMLSASEQPRKDNHGNNSEAFELPNFDHINGIKSFGQVVSRFVPGKRSDPVMKEVCQTVFSKLFHYTGYYPSSTFFISFTAILVDRYCGLQDGQTAIGNTLVLNKIQQIYESARTNRKKTLLKDGLLQATSNFSSA